MKICQSLNWVSSYTSHICQSKQTQCKYLLYVICCIWNNFKCSKDGWRREWFELNCLSIYSSFWKKVYHNFHANCTFNPVATILCPKLLLILKEKSHTLNNCVKNWSSDSIFGLSRSRDTSIDNTTQRDLLNHVENTVSTRKIGKSIPPHFNIKWYLFFQ